MVIEKNEKINKVNDALQILVLDDEQDMGEYVADVAKTMNFNCIATTNVTDFMANLHPNIQLIVLDLMMPDMDGIEILRFLKQQNCKSKIILMSGVDKRVLEIAEELANELNLFIGGHLLKPFRKAELENLLKNNMVNSPKTVVPHSYVSPLVITKNEFQLALDRNEFLVYYQPQIDLITNRVFGVEAVVRWQHPEYGLILPKSFISKAESFKLIEQLDWYVAKKALCDLQIIFEKYKSNLTLSLNASPYSLQNIKYPDMIIALATANGIDPKNITVEITESGLIQELSTALDIFTRLRMKNIKLSIDDFGTGYAMMQQLRHVPANELKIDKSFIKDMLAHENARIMTLKIIEMGHELGMKVLAEGVETVEQLEFLRANFCDRVQGYFYSRPISLSDLLKWLKCE